MSAGWVPRMSGNDLVYWHKAIDALTRLSVKGRGWKIHKREPGRNELWHTVASGEARSSARAKEAAEVAVEKLVDLS